MKKERIEMIPTTSRQAFKILDNMLTDEEKAEALSKSRAQFCGDEHFGLGLWIRNNWIYGNDKENEEKSKRRDACLEMLTDTPKGDLILMEPDGISSKFLGRYHDHLKRMSKK